MTGIICAMQLEADGILALCENTKTETIYGMTFTTGTLHDRELTVVVCGVGKVNAAMCAAILIDRFHPELIINSGVGGALSPLVSIGDLVVGSTRHEHEAAGLSAGRGQYPRRKGDVF